MTAVYILAGSSVLTGGIAAYFAAKNSHLLKLAFKTTASLLFCITALAAFLHSAVNEPSYAASVILALIFGLVGDIFLAVENFYTDKKVSSVLMLTGGASFLAGHLFYIVILFRIAPFSPVSLAAALSVPALFLLLSLIPVIKTNDGKRVPVLGAGKLLIPFLIYALILGLMLAASLNAYIYRKDNAGTLLLTAAVLFTLSDVSLAVNAFPSADFKIKPYLNYPVFILYYAAQVLFAASVAFV
ncbi:MAG: lysoplasmalogenase [Clostridiales bacterium]|jgi:uncharacterized membrane protein YhhN|nr:lysoplasmalogenase [Clostridiales bacterium]